MKRLLFILMATLLLAACGNDEPKKEEETPKQDEVKKDEPVEQEVINVTMNVEPVFDAGKAYFVGETNLPDRGVLMFTVTGPNDFTAQAKEMVLDGEFQTDVFSAKGEPLPTGVYDLSVSLSIPSTQEDDFVKEAGQDYEYLTGEFMGDGDIGKVMKYETTFTVE